MCFTSSLRPSAFSWASTILCGRSRRVQAAMSSMPACRPAAYGPPARRARRTRRRPPGRRRFGAPVAKCSTLTRSSNGRSRMRSSTTCPYKASNGSAICTISLRLRRAMVQELAPHRTLTSCTFSSNASRVWRTSWLGKACRPFRAARVAMIRQAARVATAARLLRPSRRLGRHRRLLRRQRTSSLGDWWPPLWWPWFAGGAS
mmetsp:Transcript_114928/g.256560  ORF Transcript_114928/g.256560 Transcript_114928/m.256560 type:complete len:203 (-) Transcript_114928:1301-1909(-)